GVDFGGAAELPEEAGTVRLYEVATWTVRAEFQGGQGRVTALTFDTKGRILVGGSDTTVLAWDTRPPRCSVSLERAWNDLATRDAAQSFKSEGKFLAAPAETVKLFAEKIKPVAALDPKRIQRLLADLGSNEFAVREAASDAIRGLGHQVVPYLEAALKS